MQAERNFHKDTKKSHDFLIRITDGNGNPATRRTMVDPETPATAAQPPPDKSHGSRCLQRTDDSPGKTGKRTPEIRQNKYGQQKAWKKTAAKGRQRNLGTDTRKKRAGPGNRSPPLSRTAFSMPPGAVLSEERKQDTRSHGRTDHTGHIGAHGVHQQVV